jgi:hypothetical protein
VKRCGYTQILSSGTSIAKEHVRTGVGETGGKRLADAMIKATKSDGVWKNPTRRPPCYPLSRRLAYTLATMSEQSVYLAKAEESLLGATSELAQGRYNNNVNRAYTYCIPSNDSARVLSYQELPTSIRCGEAITRRRK